MSDWNMVFICRQNPRRSEIFLFADHPRFCRYIGYSPEVCSRFSALVERDAIFTCERGTEAQQFRGLVMSEIHRWRPRRYKFEFSFLRNDRRPSQKSGTQRKNRNAPDSTDLFPFTPDDRGYLLFRDGKIWYGRETVKSQTVWNRILPTYAYALRISTAHDFRVISARTWACARTKRKRFPSN